MGGEGFLLGPGAGQLLAEPMVPLDDPHRSAPRVGVRRDQHELLGLRASSDALLTSVSSKSGPFVCPGDILCFHIFLVPLVPATPTT